MDSGRNDIEREVKEMFNNIMTKGNVKLNNLNTGDYSKGIINFMNKLINKYINIYSSKRSGILRYINFLSKKFIEKSLKSDYKYSTKNKTNIKKIILLIYLMIYKTHISLMHSSDKKDGTNFLCIKKLYHLLKKMSSILSKLYIDKVFELAELAIFIKMLIFFTVNDDLTDMKENNDIKNIMYLKECLNILFITFDEKSSEIEQKCLIQIFDYINNTIFFRDKDKKTLNYTNKIYMLHNDCKTTKLINLMKIIHKINNENLTKIYYDILSNIYYFQYSYNDFSWNLYELIEPILKNIKVKEYQTLLNEVSFPDYQLNFIRNLISKEKEFITDNSFIFKNAFYFSGKQQNSGIVTNIGEIGDHFLLAFGFNFIITNAPKKEYIVFQLKNNEYIVQFKASIFANKNNEFYLYFIDSTMNIDKHTPKIKIVPNNYYCFIIIYNKSKKKNISFYYLKDKDYTEEEFKIKEIKTTNFFFTVGCDIEKNDSEINSINKNKKYKIINSFTGFVGDIFIINLNSYKEKYRLEKNIFDLKGKYGHTIIKSLLDQKYLKEFILSNLDKTSKLNLSSEEIKKNIFRQLIIDEDKSFKIIDNIKLHVNPLNFRLVEYLDNIDYMNYDNKYHKKEELISKIKKEQQYFNNYKSNKLENDQYNVDKTIVIGNSLFNCFFNYVENSSSLVKFVEEDGIFYIYLIFEYYYQVLFRICKDVLTQENVALSKEQNEILNIIEKGIQNYLDFFTVKIIGSNFNIKAYKITLFFYQLNVVIKQFILLKTINDNLYQLLIEQFDKYQQLLKLVINAKLEDKFLYKNLRNFFFDFLLNQSFYKQSENFNLLINLNFLMDSLIKVICNDVANEEILNLNIAEKLLNFVFIFNLKDNVDKNQLKQKKDEKNMISYRKIKIKYLFLLLIYIKAIDYEKKEKKLNINIIKKLCDKILSNKDEPFIFYYLSLIIYLSDITYEAEDDFMKKIFELFEDNYVKPNIENKINSISSMLLLTSYYLNNDKIDSEKLKYFKSWYSQLSEKSAFIYFEAMHKLILGEMYEIEINLEHIKAFEADKIKVTSIKFEKRKKKSILSYISNLFGIIMTGAGFKTKYERGLKKNKFDKKSHKDNQIANIENEIKSEANIKINIKTNFDINNQEIEKIKHELNKEKYYNNYYCILDNIKNRCFFQNPKNIFIKRKFSHLFYKSLFDCKAFKIIKNKYLNLFPQANAYNKQLNYPSKIKNFSDSIGPKLFLRKNFNIYNTEYFPVSHDFLTKSPPNFENVDEEKKAKLEKLLKSNVSDINFYEHRFNINEVLEEKDRYFDCELINQQFTYFGYIILGNDYLYFGTKNEDPLKLKDKNIEIDFNYFSRFCFRNYEDYNKTSKKKTIIIFYQDIKKIIRRRTLLMYQSFEIFSDNGKNYLFNLYKKENCENAFKILATIREKSAQMDKFELITENTNKEVKKLINEARAGSINNYTYLLKLNDLASRTFNDPNQYPVFPWLFFNLGKVDDILNLDKNSIDQTEATNETPQNVNEILNEEIPKERDSSDVAEIADFKNKEKSNGELSKKFQIRNFSYPVSLQSDEKIQKYVSKEYEPHGKHYSTAGYIFFYLVRNYPFLEAMIQLQNLSKESPNRLFTSMEQCLRVLDKNLENRETIPELFSHVDFYCNLNCAFLGIQGSGNLVDDLRTNTEKDNTENLYSTYYKYVYIFRKLLNSYLISKYLPLWIDYIFGPKQIEKCKESFFKFDKVSYEEKLKLDKKLVKYIKKFDQDNDPITKKELKKKINIKIDLINNFGVTPHRVLNHTIKLRTSPKLKNISEAIIDLNENIFFVKHNDKIFILFKNQNCHDKTKKIFAWNYNLKVSEKLDKKYLNCGFPKLLQKTTIENTQMKIPIFKPCYSMFAIYKFNKIFIFTCRYLGNIFKVQCDDYSIDVLCEDFVSCLAYQEKQKNVEYLGEDFDTFYTGLKNGKLIEWKIKPALDDFQKISIIERNNSYCHKGEITCIEIYEYQNVIITGGVDKKIFIRKLSDFELLTAIDLTYCYMNDIISQKIDIVPTLIKVSKLNCIYVLLYNNDTGKSFIRGYNLNGLFFKQSEEDYFMNICFTKNYNLLVSYYNNNEIRILNCYDLSDTNFAINLDKFVENIKKKDTKGNDNNNCLVWNEYDFNNHEIILLYKNKIVKGCIKDKEEIKNLEFY